MLYKEYGVGYGATNTSLSPLENGTGGLSESQPWTLDIVKVGDEINDVSLLMDMSM